MNLKNSSPTGGTSHGEFDDLEKELSVLKPKQPSVHFVSRVEEALGEAGTIAVRRLDEREKRVRANSQKITLYIDFYSTCDLRQYSFCISSISLPT